MIEKLTQITYKLYELEYNLLIYFGFLLVSWYFYYLLMKRIKKQHDNLKVYPVEEERIPTTDHDDYGYGVSEKERKFNFSLSQQSIESLKSLDQKVKEVLIQNEILTVGDLKFASLDFLLDLNSEGFENKLSVFHECKRFLNSIDFNNGKNYSDY